MHYDLCRGMLRNEGDLEALCFVLLGSIHSRIIHSSLVNVSHFVSTQILVPPTKIEVTYMHSNKVSTRSEQMFSCHKILH